MTLLKTVLNFHPEQLPLARKEIQKLHTATKSRPNELAPSEVSVLKTRIEEAANKNNSSQALATLARTLFHRELLAAVRCIGQWTELREAVDAIARERPLSSYVALLWRVWQAYPRSSTIKKLLVEMGQRFGTKGAVGDRYSEDAVEWLQASSLIDSIVNWSDKRKINARRLGNYPGSPFMRDTPLIEYVFRRTLQIGSAEQLLRLTNADILTGWHRMSGISHMDACANFLRRIGPADWSARSQLLEEIRANYGLPRGAGERRTFWIRVSEERCTDFRNYFIKKELNLAFKKDSDRHRFWMKQRREILDICHGKAGDTEWLLIDFPGFSVVEFFAVGNAAYLYPATEPILAEIKSGSFFLRPSELKKKIFTVPGDYDNRIIHHQGWETSALLKLNTWKNHHT